MDENINLKNELLSLYKIINNQISNDKISTSIIEQNNEDINKINSISLINYIKESIPLLINQNQNQNHNNKNNNNNSIQLENHYHQLENQLIKLEIDNKYYLKNLMRYKILKDALEMKLNAYMGLEEEYEELKEKVKYEGGKFLENDRKDNEIIILRRENSTLKQEISKLENKNKKYEIKNNEYKNKINELENIIDSYNKKISNLERTIINQNLYKNLNNSNSCSNLGIMSNENNLTKIDNNNSNSYSLKNLKNVYSLNNNKKLINFYSPKFDINPLKLHKKQIPNNNKANSINSNIFNSTYNKIINNFNNKKIKIPIKNDFTLLKQGRNNSISVIRLENDESKSILINKINGDKSQEYPNLYNTGNKTKNSNRLINSKGQNIYPLTVKNNGYIIPKYIQSDLHKNINNNYSSQNI